MQRDSSTGVDTGVAVRAALLEKFKVDNRIQPVDIFPDHTEVRYYNKDDLNAANCALSILKSNGYPNAILNPRDRPASPKLLEIWLTKN